MIYVEGPVNDPRVQSSGKSFHIGIHEKDCMRDVGFELVLLGGDSLGKCGYGRGFCLIKGIATNDIIGRKVQGMFGRHE